MTTKVSGTSTGNADYDKKKYQAKRFKNEQAFYFNKFNGNSDLIPTPEQIALKKKREEEEARLQAKKYEKRHRGGYDKTKKMKRTKNGHVMIGDDYINHWIFQGLKEKYPFCCIFWFENVWSYFTGMPVPHNLCRRIGSSDMTEECDVWYKTKEGYIRCPDCIAKEMENEWCE